MVEQTGIIFDLVYSGGKVVRHGFGQQTGIMFDLVFSDGKVVRLDFGQQELCSTLFLVVGKLFDMVLGKRNYV